MKNKIAAILLILLALVTGLFTVQWLRLTDFDRPVWTIAPSVSQPDTSPPAVIGPNSTGQDVFPGGNGLWHAPVNPDYRPNYDWYTEPQNDGWWCW